MFVGVALDDSVDSEVRISVRNQIRVGNELEMFAPDGTDYTFSIETMRSAEDGRTQSVAHPNDVVFINLPQPVPRFSILRRREDSPDRVE